MKLILQHCKFSVIYQKSNNEKSQEKNQFKRVFLNQLESNPQSNNLHYFKASAKVSEWIIEIHLSDDRCDLSTRITRMGKVLVAFSAIFLSHIENGDL